MNHNPTARRCQLTSPPRRVEVEFLPEVRWDVAIRRPSNRPQTKRDNFLPGGYKRPPSSDRPYHVFVPVELLVDAEQKRAARRQAIPLALPQP